MAEPGRNTFPKPGTLKHMVSNIPRQSGTTARPAPPGPAFPPPTSTGSTRGHLPTPSGSSRPTAPLGTGPTPATSIGNTSGHVPAPGGNTRPTAPPGTGPAPATTNPSLPGSTTAIRYPQVPPGEDDPHVRINVMRSMFNDRLPSRNPPGPIDSGLYQEIKTAMQLVAEHKITHGNQISRSLTAAEIRQGGLSGTSQSIMVPTALGKERELDMVFTDPSDGKLVIVEAKSTQSVDTHQLEVNAQLAQQHGGKLLYSLDGAKPGQVNALRAQYAQLRDQTGRSYPPGLFDIMNTVNDGIGTLYFQGKLPGQTVESGKIFGLEPTATQDAIMDNDFNPDTGEEWEPSYAQ